jgi:transcriptional regulator with XRE-family HTH domain
MKNLHEMKLKLIDDIKDELKHSQMSMTDLAQKLGVSRQMVSFWLKGDKVSLDKLLDIAAVFDLEYEMFLHKV